MKKFVDNDVFIFRCNLDYKLDNIRVTVYTKPFVNSGLTGEEQENFVQEKYFTKERINKLKQELIQKIQDCENPFEISCVDRDGGYNVTEDMLFDIER